MSDYRSGKHTYRYILHGNIRIKDGIEIVQMMWSYICLYIPTYISEWPLKVIVAKRKKTTTSFRQKFSIGCEKFRFTFGWFAECGTRAIAQIEIGLQITIPPTPTPTTTSSYRYIRMWINSFVWKKLMHHACLCVWSDSIEFTDVGDFCVCVCGVCVWCVVIIDYEFMIYDISFGISISIRG